MGQSECRYCRAPNLHTPQNHQQTALPLSFRVRLHLVRRSSRALECCLYERFASVLARACRCVCLYRRLAIKLRRAAPGLDSGLGIRAERKHKQTANRRVHASTRAQTEHGTISLSRSFSLAVATFKIIIQTILCVSGEHTTRAGPAPK